MARKKKLKKKKQQKRILLSTEEEKLVNTILDGLEELNPEDFNSSVTDPKIALAILEKLPLKYDSEVSLVSFLRESFEDKAVQKTVKKVSFKLKQKGFEVPWDNLQDDTPVIKFNIDKGDPEAYLGPISMSGDRGVLIMIPALPKGIDTGLGVANCFEGISYFIYDRYSKKQCKDIKKFFFEQTVQVVETTVEHAADVLEKAYKTGAVKSGDAVAGYLKLRPLIQANIPSPGEPVIYELIDRNEAANEILTEEKLSFLFEDECMATWILDPDQMQPVIGDIIKVDSSPILLSPEQKKIRVSEIKEKALADLLPDSKVEIIKYMLEEMACFLLKQEKKEKAKTALAAALELENIGNLKTSLFIKFLMDRSLSFFMGSGKEAEEKAEPDSNPSIIAP